MCARAAPLAASHGRGIKQEQIDHGNLRSSRGRRGGGRARRVAGASSFGERGESEEQVRRFAGRRVAVLHALRMRPAHRTTLALDGRARRLGPGGARAAYELEGEKLPEAARLSPSEPTSPRATRGSRSPSWPQGACAGAALEARPPRWLNWPKGDAPGEPDGSQIRRETDGHVGSVRSQAAAFGAAAELAARMPLSPDVEACAHEAAAVLGVELAPPVGPGPLTEEDVAEAVDIAQGQLSDVRGPAGQARLKLDSMPQPWPLGVTCAHELQHRRRIES
eukprot:gnl/Chilomastix_cuspidata/7245.p1 GENE.gnl/Chilomastix_cuspidata/7245~~gnl/Chilomastix_cuspidata/7245.p1  ORF type:complete len:279 (+),score=9.80 gnl/Chilomastix_cuspidata/7245:90-926(+)